MPDKFLTSLITDLAKLRIRIYSIPNHPLRNAYASVFEAKRAALLNASPVHPRNKIGEWIDEEIKEQSRKKS